MKHIFKILFFAVSAVGLASQVNSRTTGSTFTGILPIANGGTGNTTGTAKINANLTGPITSSGNATSIASQTGTGTTFVMSVAPTLTGITTVANLLDSGLTASQAIFTDGSKNLISNAITGSGNVVMSASPTLTGTLTAATVTTSGPINANNGIINISGAAGSAGYVNISGFNSTFFNFILSAGFVANNVFDITPSTTVGGATFSFPLLRVNGSSGVVTIGNSNASSAGGGTAVHVVNGSLTISSAVTMPGLASSSAAQTGTVCWTTGGNLTVDTTVACLASIRKIKENIKPIDIGLSTVMKLEPITYNLKKEYNPMKVGKMIGFVADDVQKIDDRLVGRSDKGDLVGVRYMQLTALLTKAIQEQQSQIQELKNQIRELRN